MYPTPSLCSLACMGGSLPVSTHAFTANSYSYSYFYWVPEQGVDQKEGVFIVHYDYECY